MTVLMDKHILFDCVTECEKIFKGKPKFHPFKVQFNQKLLRSTYFLRLKIRNSCGAPKQTTMTMLEFSLRPTKYVNEQNYRYYGAYYSRELHVAPYYICKASSNSSFLTFIKKQTQNVTISQIYISYSLPSMTKNQCDNRDLSTRRRTTLGT